MPSIWDLLDRARALANRPRTPRRSARGLREAYGRYTAANRDWLSALRDVTIEMAPHLDTAARLRFSLQIAYLDRRDARFRHLMDRVPHRLTSRASLSQLIGAVDQCWSENDEAALRRLRPDYGELCAMIAAVKRKAEGGSDGFKAHLDAVTKTDRSAALLDAFRRKVEEIEREVWSA